MGINTKELENLRQYAQTDKQKTRLEAYIKYGTRGKACEALGITVSSFKKSIAQIRRNASESNIPNENGLKIVIIPDTQVRQGVLTNHIDAAARFIVKKRPNVVIFGGDHYDMPSLSVFNSKKQEEGLRIVDDLKAGNDAIISFMTIIKQGIPKHKLPRFIYITGNHCPSVRLKRYIESHPILEGSLLDKTNEFLESQGFEVYPFLKIVDVGGIKFSHYFCNPHSLKGSPVGGAIETALKNVGFSFVQFHQQTYKYGKFYLGDGSCRIGIIAGAFYQHDESYMNIQSNRHWRGIIQLNEVKDGSGDMVEVSLPYLLKHYGE